MNNKKEIYLILIGLCFLLYLNSLNNAFVSDDIQTIAKNPLISQPLRYWSDPHNFINSLIYRSIVKFNPIVYHVINICLHAVNTLLVLFFLSSFFKTETSFLGACLFAVHPIHTEAVTWISGRPYLFVALFILSTYLLYNRATDFENKGKKFNYVYYLLALAIFSYSIISPNFSFYFLFPFFLILSDFTFRRWRKNWKWWIPFLVIAAARLFFAKGQIFQRVTTLAEEAHDKGMLSNPIFNMAYSLFSNVGLMVWPAKLTLYHEPAVITLFVLRVELIILSLLILALPFIFKKSRLIFFAVTFFILFLTPTYSPVRISWLVAERYVYFPSIAMSILAGVVYEKYLSRVQARNIAMRILIIILALYAVRTVARNEDWKSPERFWRQTVLASPDSPRAHNNLGDIYSQEGNIAGALEEFKKSTQLWPAYADAYHNLANTYHRAGNIQESIKFYKLATQFNPRLFESHFNLGVIYLNAGDVNPAIEHFKQAAEIRPEDKNAQDALDIAIRKKAVNEK